jgi:hypothetical protein
MGKRLFGLCNVKVKGTFPTCWENIGENKGKDLPLCGNALEEMGCCCSAVSVASRVLYSLEIPRPRPLGEA